MFLDRLPGILRASRFETTRGGQKRRDDRLVNSQQIEHQKFHRLKHSATRKSEPGAESSRGPAAEVAGPDPLGDLFELIQRFLELHPKQTSACIQNPIVLDSDLTELSRA